MDKRNLLAFVIVILFIVVVFFLINKNIFKINLENFKYTDIKFVKIAGQSIKVDLALTEAEREQGLSGREELRDNEGMLFIFSVRDGSAFGGEQASKFWMKDMNFPIDKIWVNEIMKIVYIKKDARPESYPITYGPDEGYAKYVLEVVSGFSDKNNL